MQANFYEQPLGRVKLAIPRWRMLLGRPSGVASVIVAVSLVTFALVRAQTVVDEWTLGTGIVGALAFAWGLMSMVRAARAAEILVFNDRMVIENPSVFRQPVTIPREAIKVVSVDVTKGDRRFPIATPPGYSEGLRLDEPLMDELDEPFEDAEVWLELPRHLYTPANALLLPNVGEPNDVPNVVVLFDEPILFGPLHMLPGYVVRGRYPSGRAPERGFWGRVHDAQAAAHVLSFLGPVRGLRHEDVVPLLPSLGAVPAVRKRQALLVALFVGLAAARLVTQLWPDDEPRTSSAACDGIETMVEDADVPRPAFKPDSGEEALPQITAIEPPAGYAQVEEGFGSLEEVAGARRGFEDEWERRFRGLGFKTAFARVWTAGENGIFVEVIEFARKAGALDYVYWETSYGCGDKEIFAVPGVAGAIGTLHDLDERRVAHVHFVRGARSFYVTLWNPIGADPPPSLVHDVARRVQTKAEAG